MGDRSQFLLQRRGESRLVVETRAVPGLALSIARRRWVTGLSFSWRGRGRVRGSVVECVA